MKNNLSYYRHETGAHNHWKFRTLRREFAKMFNTDGWAGEGKFWALNNIIADATDCRLELSNTDKRRSIAIDLDFSLEEFDKFLDLLKSTCKLIQEDNGSLITDITQECYAEVSTKRKYQREWKQGKSSIENDNSNSTVNVSSIENEQSKLNETKQKQNKENERVLGSHSHFSKNGFSEEQTSFHRSLSNHIKENCAAVAKMQYQLTIEQTNIWEAKWPGPKGIEFLFRMLEVLNNLPNPGNSVFQKVNKLIPLEKSESVLKLRNDAIHLRKRLKEQAVEDEFNLKRAIERNKPESEKIDLVKLYIKNDVEEREKFKRIYGCYPEQEEEMHAKKLKTANAI